MLPRLRRIASAVSRGFPVLRRNAPALLIPLAIGVAFEPLLAGREVLWGDFITWYVPSHHYAAERLWQGSLPLWNPYSDSGMPFMAEADHGTLYPPSLLLHLVGRDPLRLFDTLQAFTLLHLVWAGLSLYALARGLERSPWAATFGGLAFALSGAFVARVSHVSLVCALSWLPLVLGGLHRALVSGRLRPALAAVAGVGLIALSGSPSSVVVAAVGAVAVALGVAWSRPRAVRLPAVGRGVGYAFALVVAGCLLGAAQLLPMRELVGLSERSAYTYEQIAAYALDPESLILLAVPRAFGWLRYDSVTYWGPPNFSELGGYAGLLTLPLAWIGFARGRAGEVRTWGLLAVAGLWLALGRSGGLHALLYLVPVVGEMRAPGRFLALWALGLALLAARGLDLVLARPRGAVVASWAGRGLLGLGLLAAWLGHRVGPGATGLLDWQQPLAALAFATTLGAVLLSAGWLAGLLRAPGWRWAGVAACLVLGLDLVAQWRGVGLHPRTEMQAVLDIEEKRYDRQIARGAPEVRVKSRYANPGRLLVNRVLSEAGPGRHLLAYERFRAAILSHDSPLLDVLGVGYLAEVRSRRLIAPGPNLIAAEGLWLSQGSEASLDLDPEVAALGVELVLTVEPVDEPVGTTLGEIELRGSDGSARHHPIRLGVETGRLGGGQPPTAADRLDVIHYVNVRDAGAMKRVYYRALLREGLAGPTRTLLLRHVGGPTSLVVKEARLLREIEPGDRWQPWRVDAAAEGFEVGVFRNTRVRPRAWVARRVRFVGSPQQAIDRLADVDLDPRLDATLEAAIDPSQAGDSGPFAALAGQAQVASSQPERIVVSARLQRPGWLVLAEVAYPGWTATAHGQRLPIVRSHGLLRAVRLEAGDHVVTFEYRPASFGLGAALSLGAALALAAALRRST